MSDDRSDDSYEVGYKKPPLHTRFQKGRSGNPKGRPKGGQNLNTVLAKELAELVTITERGRQRRITKLQASVKQLVNKAASGDHRALQLLVSQVRTDSIADVMPLSSEADQQVKQALLARLLKANPADDDGPR